MRIGLVEFLLILFIASVTVGPQVALFVDRWLRRANRASAAAARRRPRQRSWALSSFVRAHLALPAAAGYNRYAGYRTEGA